MFYFFYTFSCVLVGVLTLLIQRKKFAHLGFGWLRAMIICFASFLLPNIIVFYSQLFDFDLGFHILHFVVLLIISVTISIFISRVVIAKE